MKRTHWIADPILVGLALLASIVGLFFIFDAGYARSLAADHGFLPGEFRTQLICLPIGLLACVLCRRVSAQTWFNLGVWSLLVCVLVLIAVGKFGHASNGARRWIGAGPLSIQPAEFAKLVIVLFLASVFAFRKPWPKNLKRRSWALWMDSVAIPKVQRAIPLLGVAVVIYLVDKEPDMGTAMVLAFTTFVLLLLGGVSTKSLAAVVLIGGLGGWYLVQQEPYRIDRIKNHADRWATTSVDDTSFQTDQSELAMATGGAVGLGVGNGRAKHIIPEPTTDFVMATVAEEFGLGGALLMLGLMAAISWRLIYLAGRSSSKFTRLVLFGFATWIGFQATVNFMMANAFLPAIGVPLPFISYGGSSLVALWCAIGISQSLVGGPVKLRQRGRRPPQTGSLRPAVGR